MRWIHVYHSQPSNQILEYILYVKPCVVEPGYSDLKNLAVLSDWTDCFRSTHFTPAIVKIIAIVIVKTT